MPSLRSAHGRASKPATGRPSASENGFDRPSPVCTTRAWSMKSNAISNSGPRGETTSGQAADVDVERDVPPVVSRRRRRESTLPRIWRRGEGCPSSDASLRGERGRGTRPQDEGDFVEVAPAPVFARLGRADDGMAGSRACAVAWRFGEESQQPILPQVMHIRRCTQRPPIAGSPRSRRSRRAATSPRSCRDGCRRRSWRQHLDERGRVIRAAVNSDSFRKSVGVPRTSPDSTPLSTSRRMRARTASLARSSSNRSRSRARSRA